MRSDIVANKGPGGPGGPGGAPDPNNPQPMAN